jgi:hypothetical protein
LNNNTNNNTFLFVFRSKPLSIWDSEVKNGHIKRITDADIQSSVVEVMGSNVSTTFIQTPIDPKETLGIKLPFLVMIIKNVNTRIIYIRLLLYNSTPFIHDFLYRIYIYTYR